MMTTETDDGGKVDALVLQCDWCQQNSTLMPTACRLTLYTHGLMLLKFFCLHCHELVVLQINRVSFAQRIEQTGVPTNIVRVPDEVAEHPVDGKPITEQACRYIESVPLNYFYEAARRELGLR